ncbi:hypothetical protein EYR36_000191 [Pleurotus pulmonarius]|nr:hypothetical protein EYR36_000191 [Pleurotus pulmonarius]
MLVERASYAWAFADDIPGSRCDAEDGPWPRAYQILENDQVWRELNMLAKPQTSYFDGGFRADSLNFQPCLRTRTQDRYVSKELDIHGRKWVFTGVFDGHLGDVTVEHVSHHLPIIVSEFLTGAFQPGEPQTSTPEFISNLFTRSIEAFDEAIAQDVLGLFGGSIEYLANYTDADIRRIINDHGPNYRKARLCMYGTTALVSLVDPEHTSLWVAQLGDCQATLVTYDEKRSTWAVERLTREQNGGNDEEIARVRAEHPGEPECVVDRRVLGALAPFRCLGDIPFKQHPDFSRRILYNLLPGFHDTAPWEEFLVRNLTPPYISSTPEIAYRRLDSSRHSLSATPTRFLILASDGFADLCGDEAGQEAIVKRWVEGLTVLTGAGAADDSWTSGKHVSVRGSNNMALRLLREALGGDDHFSVSKVLTLDMETAWIDDTAIIVQTL